MPKPPQRLAGRRTDRAGPARDQGRSGSTPSLITLSAAVAAAILAVGSITAATLLQAWPYWITGFLVAVVSCIISTAILVRRRRQPHGAFRLGALCVVLVQLHIVAMVAAAHQATESLRCEQAKAKIEKGRDFQKNGEGERAISEYHAALGSCEDGRAHLYKGQVEFDFGRYEVALESIDQAIAKLPSNDTQRRRGAFLDRGQITHQLGRCDEAAVALLSSIGVDRKFDPAYHNLALVRIDQGVLAAPEYLGALEAMDRAIALNPRQSDYLFTRGWIKWLSSDFAGAATDFTDATAAATGTQGAKEKAERYRGPASNREEPPAGVFRDRCKVTS